MKSRNELVMELTKVISSGIEMISKVNTPDFKEIYTFSQQNERYPTLVQINHEKGKEVLKINWMGEEVVFNFNFNSPRSKYNPLTLKAFSNNLTDTVRACLVKCEDMVNKVYSNQSSIII